MQSVPVDPSMEALYGRPSFLLEPDGTKLDATLPEAPEPDDSLGAGRMCKWYLDFTEGGKYLGVVMSQSRMRDIENILNPLGSLDDLDSMHVINNGLGSWVDLIVSFVLKSFCFTHSRNGQVNTNRAPSGRYTSVYVGCHARPNR